MTTVTKANALKAPAFDGVPFGDAALYPFNFTTIANGIFGVSDLATAVQSGDVIRLGILPTGLTLVDCTVIISDAFTSSTTASIGFAYIDGVDSTPVPQSATYFASALATDATGITRKTAVTAPVTLPKAAYLILTIGGAAHAAVGVMDIVVSAIVTGFQGS